MIRSAGYFPAFNRYFLPAARKNKHQLKTQKDTFELFSLHDENTKTAHHLHFAPAA